MNNNIIKISEKIGIIEKPNEKEFNKIKKEVEKNN